MQIYKCCNAVKKYINTTLLGTSGDNSCLLLVSLSALYGVLFPRAKEAAFANYRMWESLGFVIAFAYSTFICLQTKLYILLFVLLLTAVTYPVAEYVEYKNPTAPIEEGVYSNDREAKEGGSTFVIAECSL